MRMETLAESAVALHEMFLSMLGAGFTEDQALKFLAYCVTGGGTDDTDRRSD